MPQGATVSVESETRVCTRCGEEKIPPKEIRPKGIVCNHCKGVAKWKATKANPEKLEKHNATNRRWREINGNKYHRAWRKKNYEKLREQRLINYQKMKNGDPAKYQEYLENHRISGRLLREKKGNPSRVISIEQYRKGCGKVKRDEVLATAPLAEFMNDLGLSYMELALICDVDEALIRRIMNGEHSHKPLVTIDQIATSLGMPLALLYGDDFAVGRAAAS